MVRAAQTRVSVVFKTHLHGELNTNLLKGRSLIYTHIVELPDWFKDFTKLEYLYVQILE